MIIYTVTWHDYDRTEVVGTFSGIEEACKHIGATMEDLDHERGNVEDKICVFGYESYTITMTVLDDLVPSDNTGYCFDTVSSDSYRSHLASILSFIEQ